MEMPSYIAHWGRRLCSRDTKPMQIRSGINSMVFLCRSDSECYILKGYGSRDSGIKQRMLAELQFLRYANQVAPTYVPDVIAVDHERGCLVLEHIEGIPYPQGFRVDKVPLRHAARFLKALNSERRLAKRIIRACAKEGCLSLYEQMGNISTHARPQMWVEFCENNDA